MIGLITGERSDAEKDVHRNAELRWPQVRFRTAHVAVQGERCVPETLAALATLDADLEVDVIVIARGGGDPQTLLGFSDERLLRAVAAASTPIVSAIGHENDHPLLDDVADLRASTPTDAAMARISSSVSPAVASAGCDANIACRNGRAASSSATATQYIALAARVENSVPCEARSRIEIGWISRVVEPSSTSPSISGP